MYHHISALRGEIMGGRKRKTTSWKRVLVDICTQNDFLEADAIMQVANRKELIANLQHVFAWARSTNAPVVSCIESHRPTEPINGWPLHCIDGTQGQRKPDYSLLEPRILIEADNSLALPPDLMQNYQQILFRKRARDIFGNPKTDRFLTQLQSEDFILFGVGLERAVRGLALGLLSRHKHVTVVIDACGVWSPGDSDLVIRQLTAKGVTLITTEVLTAPPPVKPSTPRRIVYHGRVLNRHHPASTHAEAPTRRRVGNS